MSRYCGRFAPSPTGSLHAGSLVAALASWLDARANNGRWLVRIEDVDRPRCMPGADEKILDQLRVCGFEPDEPPVWQSSREHEYETALERLISREEVYPCGCSRREIEHTMAQAQPIRAVKGGRVYPGTCRNGLRGKAARAMRVRTCDGKGSDIHITWFDRRLGPQAQNLTQTVGDFVIKRADGLWAYQLAVVVDDAAQGITHVVRGEDLADNTPRQIHLQRLLGLPQPTYMHTPLVKGPGGEKLSKQNGAPPLDLSQPIETLRQAGRALGLPELAPSAQTPAAWLSAAIGIWRDRWPIARPNTEPHRTDCADPLA